MKLDINDRKLPFEQTQEDVENWKGLVLAVRGADFAKVKMFVNLKADINGVSKENINSPLMSCAYLGHNAILLFLIENGGNVNKKRINKAQNVDLIEIVSSKYKTLKGSLISLQTNQKTLEIVKFYQEISKEILELVNRLNLDLGQLQSGMNSVDERVSPENKKFTISSEREESKEIPAPKIDPWKMPLDHEGKDSWGYLFARSVEFAKKDQWELVQFLERNGLQTDLVDSENVSVDKVKKLYNLSVAVLDNVSHNKIGTNVAEITVGFSDNKDRYNLSLVSKAKLPDTSPQSPKAKKSDVKGRLEENSY